MHLDDAFRLVADVPDFPKAGVVFRDITPVLANGDAFSAVVRALADTVDADIDVLAAVESRGFLFAAAAAYATGRGVALVRKPGKLPNVAASVDYALEYGLARLELPVSAIGKGDRVAVVDDVLATGGTTAAAAELVERAGATVSGISVVIELAGLGGRDLLVGRTVRSLKVC